MDFVPEDGIRTDSNGSDCRVAGITFFRLYAERRGGRGDRKPPFPHNQEVLSAAARSGQGRVSGEALPLTARIAAERSLGREGGAAQS